MRPGARSWWHQLSLRMRMVLVAAVAVAVVAVAGGVLTLLLARSLLIEAADDLGEARADQLADLALEQKLSWHIPRADDVEAAVQVVRDGQVVSATSNARDREAIPLGAQEPGAEHVVPLSGLDIDDDGPFRVLARGINTPDGPTTIFVVVDIEDINEMTGALVAAQGAGLLVLLVAMGVVLWVVVGRTLAPVEAIRRRAEVITGNRLQQRVPEPAGNDEVGRLARTINAMLARLQESARRQDRFVADAAHELRTPLATLRAQLEEAMDRHAPDQHDATLLADLWEQTDRMELLVDQLLLLARSDAGTVRVQWEPVDLEDLVEEVVMTSYFSTRPVRKGRCEPVQVRGEPALLELVVRNLLDNAVRHAASTVEVSVTSDGHHARLDVEDDGPGIPVQHRSEVFDRFVRLDDARTHSPGGSGLGLAIVKEVIGVHGGTVEAAESRLGGARLRVSLPLESEVQISAPSSEVTPGVRGRM